MKFTVIFLIIAVCLLVSAQGFRHKRSMSFELCPKNVDCETYAKEKAKKSGPCFAYSTNGKSITYLGCGTASCGDNGREFQDLSKPYPQCCPNCEVIDPSKLTEFSITG